MYSVALHAGATLLHPVLLTEDTNWPEGHTVHMVAPVDATYLPTGQPLHALESSEYVPTGHEVHTLSQYAPLPHGSLGLHTVTHVRH